MSVTSQISSLKNKINETETKIRNVKRWEFLTPLFLFLAGAACAVAAYFGYNALAHANVSASLSNLICLASMISVFLAIIFFMASIANCINPGPALRSRDQITRMNNWEKSLMADREELKQLETQALPACSQNSPICSCNPTCVPLPQVVS